MLPALALALALALPAPTTASTPPQMFHHKTEAVMSASYLPYQGKYFIPGQGDYTLCVLRRESNSHWFSTNRAGGYFGAFQFNKALTVGATWMITPELKALYGVAQGRRIAHRLRYAEMHKWAPYYQHMAFATVLNWTSPYSGAKHWAGGRFHCPRT